MGLLAALCAVVSSVQYAVAFVRLARSREAAEPTEP